MKNIFAYSLTLILISTQPLWSQQEIVIIPQPNEVQLYDGESFVITDKTRIVSNESSQFSAEMLQEAVYKSTGKKLAISAAARGKFISYVFDKTFDKEAYELKVDKRGIQIKASEEGGWFYGTQSLIQLLENYEEIGSMTINDAPRFSWRAFMLDESRHFQGMEFVKQTLDEMSRLKMNVFHWHLVDDAGWRIEIKKYPKLTQIGSKRADTEIETWKSGKLAGEPHSGFYTQEEIREIVDYAAKRQITVVPEIEMPGHSSAAIASYPWLGTEGKLTEVPVLFGRHYDNYDVTKPEVVEFIHNVLTEVFDLFPSKVIHIGGDEVDYSVWKETKHVQDYMQKHGINSPADLQIKFTNEISQFIEENDRRMMGWNEILGLNIHGDFEEKKDDLEAETELAKNVVVHFWKGDIEMIRKAAEKGYAMVNSLHSSTYLDYSYKSIPLGKAYAFDPIPGKLDEKFHKNIYGLGCQMWGEWTPDSKTVEYQTYPRIAAYAEVGWTNRAMKDYDSFVSRLKMMQKRWDSKGINYAKVLD